MSWTVPLYILGANFVEQMSQDEDRVPMNGNPHPLPRVPFPEMPPYPAMGWNDVPHPLSSQHLLKMVMTIGATGMVLKSSRYCKIKSQWYSISLLARAWRLNKFSQFVS